MKFKYWARTGGGKVQTGAIDASSREAAIDLLKSNGLSDPLAKHLHNINRRVDMQLF